MSRQLEKPEHGRALLCTLGLGLMGTVLLTGCGSSSESDIQRVAVFGQVEFQDKAISGATIIFHPAEGHSGPTAGAPIDSGEFRFTTENGPTAGPHRAVIRWEIPNQYYKQWKFDVEVPRKGAFEKNFDLQ